AQLFIAPVIAMFEQQIQAIDREIAALIAAEISLARAVATLRTICGIGPKTAAALVRLDRRRIAALAGLAPHPRQSGGADAYRRVHGGRAEVKRVLFMAALT